ncbi:MAG: AraC family transcriptional regulator [Sphingomonadales bacterium]
METLAPPDSGQEPSAWHEVDGTYRLCGGTSPIRSCEPHFHDTYIIAYIRAGGASLTINGAPLRIERGAALFANPFDVIGCASDSDFEYDVCYPDRSFMKEAAARACLDHDNPRFRFPIVRDAAVTAQLESLFRAFNAPGLSPSDVPIESLFLDFLARNGALFTTAGADDDIVGRVGAARALIETLVETPIPIADISAFLKTNRSHLSRRFREATGLPPSSYFRQLRLARAFERVRDGEPLADIALLYGFFDQAHFSREFKRVYGTPPGQLAREISRCRHCERAPANVRNDRR